MGTKAARIAALDAENRRLRLQLLLLTDPAQCAHEWAVQGTRMQTGGGMDRTDYVDLVCVRCYHETSRRVTRAWLAVYDALRAEGAA